MSRRRDLELQRGLADNPAHATLLITLDAAVPLWIAELRKMTPAQRTEAVTAWAAAAVEPIASKGDILIYPARRPGQTADVFNHLARGLAALAHMPGGVLFAGRHWCTTHWMGIAAGSITELSCSADGLEHEQPERPAPPVPRIVTVTTTAVL